jgi:hypothetical protein
MAFLAAAPLIEALGTRLGASAIGRTAMQFGARALASQHEHQEHADERRQQDRGISRYIRDNPGEIGLLLGAQNGRPNAGARAAQEYSSLSYNQFG